MEENPIEAVRNNAVATRIVAAAAGECGAKRFVLVSTDKAVNPATVMGASKTLAEWAVEAAQHRFEQTRFTTVRFGNVLGSSGSVVPIFRRQIAAGGPVTVTDENMTRYFMTIPEAVQLIIRSGSMGRGGEIYVLEMGEPVRIIDLARKMIQLSGREPDREVAIEVVGRRPGEKLHEELFNPDEEPQPDERGQDHRRGAPAARGGLGRGGVRPGRGARVRGRRARPRRDRLAPSPRAGACRTPSRPRPPQPIERPGRSLGFEARRGTHPGDRLLRGAGGHPRPRDPLRPLLLPGARRAAPA